MPEGRKVDRGRGLSAAGLIAATAATLLMMVWAVFPTSAGASHGTVTPPLGTPDAPWDDNVPICHATGSAGNPFVPNHPAIAANNIPAIAGHSSHTADIVPPFYYDDDNDDTTPGVLSVGVNFSGANITTWANNCVVQGTTSQPPTTEPPTTEPPTTEPPTTEPPTTEPPTTEPPTTEPPTTSVSGTTVTPPSSTPPGTTVLPTTVSPPGGGTAFTGAEGLVPLGAIALLLLSGGSGLMWAGSRRRRKAEEGKEE